jgi:hypothetical protein
MPQPVTLPQEAAETPSTARRTPQMLNHVVWVTHDSELAGRR